MKAEKESAKFLAKNVNELRSTKRWTQAQLAERAGIPRSTITHIESGQGNPSLQNLARISRALNIGLDELLARPKSEAVLLRAREIPQISRGRNPAVIVYRMAPDQIRGLQIDRIELPKGAKLKQTPQIPGTREYLTVLQGGVTVSFAEEDVQINRGDMLAVAADRERLVRNTAATKTLLMSIVVPL